MAQHDMIIDDQAGLSFLSDLNAVLAALVSNSSGASAPATMTAYMLWADTTSGWLKQRNAANNAWINKLKLADATSTVGSALVSAADAAAARTAIGAVIGADVQAFAVSASQAEMEAGTEAALRAMSPLRVAQAVAALATSTVDDVTISLLMIEIADLQNQAQVMGPTGNRFADSFDALTYVDTGAATNLDTGTAGKLLPSSVAGTDQTGSGTPLSGGNHGDGTLAGAFDNNQTTRWASSQSTTGVSGVAYVGYDFGSGVTKNITSATVRQGYSGSGSDATGYSIASIKIQYSDNGSAWSDAHTWAIGQTSYNAGVQTSPTFASVGAHRYWRLLANGNPASSYWNVHEVELIEPGSTNNLTVASTALTAASAPATMSALMRVDYVDTPTLNTDLMLDVSRDGGTTWTTSTLSLAYTAPGSIKVLTTNSVSVSGQPSGTSPKWRIRTANNKMVHVRDVYLYWS